MERQRARGRCGEAVAVVAHEAYTMRGTWEEKMAGIIWEKQPAAADQLGLATRRPPHHYSVRYKYQIKHPRFKSGGGGERTTDNRRGPDFSRRCWSARGNQQNSLIYIVFPHGPLSAESCNLVIVLARLASVIWPMVVASRQPPPMCEEVPR